MKELVDNVSHYRFLIDGEWQESESDKRIEVENPANGEVFAEIQAGTPKDAVRALESAEKAQKKWAELPAVERGNILKKVAEKLLANKEELAKLLVREQGKLYVTAKGEVEVSADFISFAAESGRRIEGDIYPSDKPNEHIWIHKVPYGVCVGITAWNFPLALAARKVGPALIAGNTMVIKPTSETPLATLEFGQLALEAGVPKGVLNIITGVGKYGRQRISRESDHKIGDPNRECGSGQTGVEAIGGKYYGRAPGTWRKSSVHRDGRC